jgi:hypothetical protein
MKAEENQALSLEVVFDFVGYVEYYSGHGHAFVDDRVVACLPFGVYVSYRETVGEIIDMILEDLNSRVEPILFLNEAEKDQALQDKIREFLTDERVAEAIKAELGSEVKESEPFFEEVEDLGEEEEEEDSCLCDGPILIGYIHVWKE